MEKQMQKDKNVIKFIFLVALILISSCLYAQKKHILIDLQDSHENIRLNKIELHSEKSNISFPTFNIFYEKDGKNVLVHIRTKRACDTILKEINLSNDSIFRIEELYEESLRRFKEYDCYDEEYYKTIRTKEFKLIIKENERYFVQNECWVSFYKIIDDYPFTFNGGNKAYEINISPKLTRYSIEEYKRYQRKLDSSAKIRRGIFTLLSNINSNIHKYWTLYSYSNKIEEFWFEPSVGIVAIGIDILDGMFFDFGEILRVNYFQKK